MCKIMLLQIFLPVIITKTYCDINNNKTDTDIFIKFSHAEANPDRVMTIQPETSKIASTVSTLEVTPVLEDTPETIVFIPNDAPERNEDVFDSNLRINDIMMTKTVGDAIDKNIHVETDQPPEDIVFVSGKNIEKIEEEPLKTRRTQDIGRSGKVMKKGKRLEKIKLNCTNLDCNNTIKSICGGKVEHSTWRYRLFLNECYFRKVNCNFKYAVNRYRKVPLEKCKNMGVHGITFSFKPKPVSVETPEKLDINARRTFSSRRSLTMGLGGQFCSHPCPVSCSDDYDPECAVSPTGRSRVFVNHCKLDFNSCSYGVAYPTNDPVLGKWDAKGLRYDYLEADDGSIHLVDNWMKFSDYEGLARYDPDTSNQYHLFTRANPSVSQVIIVNNAASVTSSNFSSQKRTIVLMHGFLGSATSAVNTVLVPAFLSAEDVNVIVLDWSAGSIWGPRALQAGQAGGRFLNWLMGVTGISPSSLHIVGFSVGGQGAGIMGRTVNGDVGYVTGLDPADRWDEEWLFQPTDGTYTEVIHTNAGDIGYSRPLADVDFYPNGGRFMPGCITNLCDHDRSFHYMAESLISGGFTGIRCNTWEDAILHRCTGSDTLRMGGIAPKTGSSGIFFMRTNRSSPFSQG